VWRAIELGLNDGEEPVRVIVYSLRDSWSEPLNPFMLSDMGKTGEVFAL